MIAKKTGEMKKELEDSAALVHSYLPPASDELQAVIRAGELSICPGADAAAIRFADYAKAGDSLTLTGIPNRSRFARSPSTPGSINPKTKSRRLQGGSL